MQAQFGTALHVLGQGLLTPCLIILLLLMAVAVWQVGDLLVEVLTERRRLKADIPALLVQLHGQRDDLKTVIASSGLLRRQKAALMTLIEARGMPRASMVALAQRLLATEEGRYGRITAVTDMVAKLGPMFGLLGTLIPLGPGILALGSGDTGTLSKSLAIAFDTTIAGLISAAVAVVISAIRKRWYNDYLFSMESIMDCILEEVAPDAA
ncbi:MAG: MotA/TolQ/ExbB proton channel family protein [Pseudoflavonifractor sp.]